MSLKSKLTGSDINEACMDSDLRILTSLQWPLSVSPTAKPNAFMFPISEDQLLSYHRDRLIAAAAALSWNTTFSILSCSVGQNLLKTTIKDHISSVYQGEKDTSQVWKVRVLLNQQGTIFVDSAPIEVSPNLDESYGLLLPTNSSMTVAKKSPCSVYVDTEVTTASVLTTHKTTARKEYNDARARMKISALGPNEAEVLLYNKAKEVMEGSLCTPYFFRNGNWITPPLASGGNAGVTRRVALENGLCTEARIEVDTLYDGEIIWLSNAVRGFIQGRVKLS